MPRRSKGPHLWYRPASATHAARYIILDAGTQLSLGSITQTEAERALADYIAEKHRGLISTTKREPDKIPVADVLEIYARDVAPGHARPDRTAQSLRRLADFFAARSLSSINGAMCRAYTRQASTESMAWLDLSYLRAAITHHRKEGLHDRIVTVVLPDRGPSRERWLTRSEAAKLVRTAWRRRGAKHIAKFIVFALHTGRRHTAIVSASFLREPGRPWIDLDGRKLWPPEGVKQTKKRQPPIPIPRKLLVLLRLWHKRGQRYVVERAGRPVLRLHTLQDIGAHAGLGADVVPHTLRHTAATWLMQRDANVFRASRYLGMTVETLEKIYAHHKPDDLIDVADAPNRRMAK
jgi:integrase